MIMQTVDKSLTHDYMVTSRSVREIEAQIAEAIQRQHTLRQLLESQYEQLKDEFALRWSPVRTTRDY
jgi:hypothetical protein